MDPRTSVRYARMVEVVNLINTKGPRTKDQILKALKITDQQFKLAHYSLPGMLALEDYDVVIPRPVPSENYVYKLASAYKTGIVADDGEPNMQSAAGDLLTRVATVYIDVERLTSFVSGSSRRLLRKLMKSLEGTIDRADDLASESGATISSKAQYVLDKIA